MGPSLRAPLPRGGIGQSRGSPCPSPPRRPPARCHAAVRVHGGWGDWRCQLTAAAAVASDPAYQTGHPEDRSGQRRCQSTGQRNSHSTKSQHQNRTAKHRYSSAQATWCKSGTSPKSAGHNLLHWNKPEEINSRQLTPCTGLSTVQERSNNRQKEVRGRCGH